MNDYLNPTLHRRLVQTFGHVRVTNLGEENRIFRRPDWNRKGRLTVDVVSRGETYNVNCPFCSDTRQRLAVNYHWGRSYEKTSDDMLHLVYCFNEGCLKTRDKQKELHALVFPTGVFGRELGEIKPPKVGPGKSADLNVEASWPGEVKRVDKLPQDHKAVQYLLSRSFDPQAIGKFYNVHYCRDSIHWLAKDRLIIPVYADKKFKGWQARYIGEINWKKPNAPPKYYTSKGMRKSLLLYNIENASQYKTGVIVEGVTDVWSFGPMACCTLGCNMSLTQRQLFHRRFRKHSAVLLYDPEEFHKESTQRLILELDGHFDRGFAAVKLPEGKDPGKLERSFLHEFVAKEAKALGVKVSWEKR